MLKIIKDVLTKIAKFIFTCGGSILTITIYTIFGGFMFQFIEKEQEKLTKVKVKKLTSGTIKKFRNYILTSFAENVSLESSKLNEMFIDYTKRVCELKNEDGWNGNFGESEYNWTIEGSILFAVTVITTIGYGVTTPKTRTGKLITIIYAIIGIPFTFVSLSNIGQHFSKAFVGGYLMIRNMLYSKTKRFNKQVENFDIQDKKDNTNLKPQEIKMRKVHSKLRYKSKYMSRQGPIINWDNIDRDLFIYSIGSERDSSINTIPELDEDFEEWLTKCRSVNVSYLTYDRIYPEDKHQPKPIDLPYSQVRIPMSVTFLIMVFYILIGALFLTVWEEKDYLKWAYFCFITLSTIGFGDIVPGTKIDSDNPKEKLIFVAFYVIVGLSVFSMCFKLMEEEIRYKWNMFLAKIRK